MKEREKNLFKDIYNFVYETAAAHSVPDCKAVMDATVTMYSMHREISVQRDISDIMERVREATIL